MTIQSIEPGQLTARQVDGIACVVCGDEHAVMEPFGAGPHGQLFRCTSHKSQSAA